MYSDNAEKLRKAVVNPAAAAPTDADASAAAARACGISDEAHAMATAGGFSFDSSQRLYYNGTSGLYYDPQSSLYWQAVGGDCYYYWDAEKQTLVPYAPPSAAEAMPSDATSG